MVAVPIHLNVDVSYGAPLVGLVISSLLSGVAAIQIFLYYRCYPRDHILLKSLVAFVWLIDFGHLIAISHFVYFYTVTHWGDLSAVSTLPWSLVAMLLLNTIMASSTHLFLIFRFKVISNGNWWMTSVLAFLALIQLVSGIISASQPLKDKSAIALAKGAHESKILGGLWIASGTVVDVLIALSLAYYLHKRAGMSSAIVDRLIIYISSTGILTSVIALVNFITYLALTQDAIFLTFNFILGRIYMNSLLSSLNMRHALRNSGGTSPEGPFVISVNRAMVTTVDYGVDIRSGRPKEDQSSKACENTITIDSTDPC